MSGPDPSSTPGSRRAWAWVAHLRRGGTTPWSQWSGAVPESGRLLPGAQQLELLRHLNRQAALAAVPVPAPLVERVLTASAPGRGRPDFELEGAVARLRFGPAPLDPGTLPAEELVRVAAGLLAEDLVVGGAHPAEPRVDRSGRYRAGPDHPRRPRRWRTAYLLGGDPWIVDPARARLIATGRPPGGRDATAVLVGTDLATLLVDTWTARCFGDGAPPWREFLAQQVDTGHLPPRADLAAAAARWSSRVGSERVVVVLDPGLLPRQVGVRRPLPARPVLAAHATELAREVGPALGLLVTPPRGAQLLTTVLLPRLASVPGARLVVPSGRMRWLQRQARRQQRALSAAGYAVLGHPDLLLPRGHTGVPVPPEQAVLDLALRMLLTGPEGTQT